MATTGGSLPSYESLIAGNDSTAYLVSLIKCRSSTDISSGPVHSQHILKTRNDAVNIPNHASWEEVLELLESRARLRFSVRRERGDIEGYVALHSGNGKRGCTIVDRVGWRAGRRLLDQTSSDLTLRFVWKQVLPRPRIMSDESIVRWMAHAEAEAIKDVDSRTSQRKMEPKPMGRKAWWQFWREDEGPEPTRERSWSAARRRHSRNAPEARIAKVLTPRVSFSEEDLAEYYSGDYP